MNKYHFNRETGRANICRASKGKCPLGTDTPHFNTKEEAKEYLINEAKNSNETFTKLTKASNKILNSKDDADLQEAIKVRDIFKRNGFSATLARDMKIKFYHDTSNDSPTVVRSFDENFDGPRGYNKPGGVLWLSSGVTGDNGKIITGWRDWSHGEQWGGACDNSKTFEINLKPEALILEINEYNVGKINNMLDPEAPIFQNQVESDYDYNPYSFIDSINNPINWGNIKAAGVDAVRVDGTRNRGYFYGYDVDSLIILNGDVVEGFTSRDGAQSKDDFTPETLDKYYENKSFTIDGEEY